MKDEIFLKLLDEAKIFAGNQFETMKAKETSAARALFLLDDVIERDVGMYFPRLLEAMEEHDGDEDGTVSKLAREIQSKTKPRK